MLNKEVPYYQERLREELVKRIDRNPRYSLRAFATALGIGASALSLILAGKRSISTKVINRLFEALELSSSEKKKFIESILQEKLSMGLQRVSPELKSKLAEAKKVRDLDAAPLGTDHFRVIADWYHYAILELTVSPSFKPQPKWLSRVLQISEVEAKLALERLIKLELLEEQDGVLKKTNLKIDTKDKSKTSLFHRKRQKQILEKSIQSLEQDPIEVRNHSSVTLCIDPARVTEAKERIQKLMWELTEFLIEGKQEQVYELNMSLFPLSSRMVTEAEKKDLLTG